MPEITVPKGYDFEDILDTDDSGCAHESPILVTEVKVIINREASNNDADNTDLQWWQK